MTPTPGVVASSSATHELEDEGEEGFLEMFHPVAFRAWNSDVRLKLVTSVSFPRSSFFPSS